MGPDEDNRQQAAAEIELLRVRVERLERDVAALRQGSQAAIVTTPPVQPLAVAVSRAEAIPPPPPMVKPPPKASLENRLGSQVFNRIGIVALLIGTTWFLKWAIDNHWIGALGRVLIGLVAGAGIILWSERFRRQGVTAFSYSLKAVGSGVLYLSLWAAFQLYHLLPASVALGAMILVTAWNAFMAWSQDAELLAAYALIGGFATPLLLSTGGNHEIFLFTYLLAIDIAAVLLVRLKAWPRLLIGTFPITVLYFIGWYTSFFRADALVVTAVFALLFWVVFLTPSILSSPSCERLKPEEHAESPVRRPFLLYFNEILLPLGDAAFVALALYSVLQDSGRHLWLPWLMVALAAAYLGLVRLPQSRLASALHLSLAVVFLTIAIPLKASGHWITVAWLMEGVALFWVSERLAAGRPGDVVEAGLRDDVVLRWLSGLAMALGFLATIAVPYWFSPSIHRALFNHDVATALVGILAFAAIIWLGRRSRIDVISIQIARFIAIGALAVLLTLREIIVSRFDAITRTAFFNADFSASLIGICVLAAMIYVALRLETLRKEGHEWRCLAGGLIITFNLVAILVGVREIGSFWIYSERNPSDGLKQALAISAFLMAYSAMMLAVGFWKRSAFVRWQGLILLVFTIAKTFLYDMSSLSQGYRVVSFLGLGVLLMAVSFAYQKDWLSLREPSKDHAAESIEDKL